MVAFYTASCCRAKFAVHSQSTDCTTIVRIVSLPNRSCSITQLYVGVLDHVRTICVCACTHVCDFTRPRRPTCSRKPSLNNCTGFRHKNNLSNFRVDNQGFERAGCGEGGVSEVEGPRHRIELRRGPVHAGTQRLYSIMFTHVDAYCNMCVC